MKGEVLRQMAAALQAVADLCDKEEPMKEMLNRLDLLYPRKESLSAVDMARYWNVSEATARERMHAQDFPSEKMGFPEKNGRLVVSKMSLVLYEIKRS